jgi:hypothetical protein
MGSGFRETRKNSNPRHADYDYAELSGLIGTDPHKSVRENGLGASPLGAISRLVTLNDDESGTLKAH